MSKISGAEVAGVLCGCFGIVVLIGLALSLALSAYAALIYLLMNVLLPIVGVVYPLTWFQCFAAGLVVWIVSVFVKGVFSVTVKNE